MLERRRTADGLVFYVSPRLEALRVPHAFSTRAGGVSPPPFASLNLGISRDSELKDSRENILENYRRLASAIGCAGRERCWVSQVHGADVCAVRRGSGFESGTCADALVTDDPARIISVKYADCVPILLASPDGRAVAAVHAGWRGIVAGVLPAAITRMAEVAGCGSGELVAAVGPCIGFDVFEVGPEVLDAFGVVFGVDAPMRRLDSGKGRVDLRESVRRQLIKSGVGAARIDVATQCTFADAAEFYSHRRDGVATGRMAALIATAAEG
jgi:YfiH family protein